MKYIDADKLEAALALHYAEITIPVLTDEGGIESYVRRSEIHVIQRIIDSLTQEQTDMGEVSDGYHTFNELYYYRMLYNAAFFNLLPKEWVHKSKRHHTGEECFGGGWFIVMANLPTGQISNHYELKYWDLFKVPEKEIADEWDGHSPQEAAERLYKYLQQEQSEPSNNLVDIDAVREDFITEVYRVLDADPTNDRANAIIDAFDSLPTVSQEQPEMDLNEEIYFWLEGGGLTYPISSKEENNIKNTARTFYELGLKAAREDK